MKQQVRIIGGKFRGKKLTFPVSEGLRPTPDRIKETLFNWLMNHLIGSRCLDAFSGSGALGLEAFSRGADEVILIEKSAPTYKNLQHTINSLNTATKEKIELIKTDALDYLKSQPRPFDIIFIDPPFSDNNHLEIISLISREKLLNQGGLLYVEAPTQLQFDQAEWKILQFKHSGSVYYSLLTPNY